MNGCKISNCWLIHEEIHSLQCMRKCSCSNASGVNTLSQQQRTSHAPNVRSHGQEPSVWYTWFGMTVLLSEMNRRFIFIWNVAHRRMTRYDEKQVIVVVPDPAVAGTSRACILAWISSDAWGVPPTQADTWSVSRTHSGFGQQSVSVSFWPHKRRFLSRLSRTRTADWKKNTRHEEKCSNTIHALIN